jgi:hypothetical protein
MLFPFFYPHTARYTLLASCPGITPVVTFYGCRRIYGIGLSPEGGENP